MEYRWYPAIQILLHWLVNLSVVQNLVEINAMIALDMLIAIIARQMTTMEYSNPIPAQ